MHIGIGIGLCFNSGRSTKTAGALRYQVGLPLMFLPEMVLSNFALLFGDVVTDSGGFDTGAYEQPGFLSLLGRTQLPTLSLMLFSDKWGVDITAMTQPGWPSLIGRAETPSISLLLCSNGYGL